MIVFLAREPEGWYVRLDRGEPDPPVVRPAALVCSPSAEAYCRSAAYRAGQRG